VFNNTRWRRRDSSEYERPMPASRDLASSSPPARERVVGFRCIRAGPCWTFGIALISRGLLFGHLQSAWTTRSSLCGTALPALPGFWTVASTLSGHWSPWSPPTRATRNAHPADAVSWTGNWTPAAEALRTRHCDVDRLGSWRSSLTEEFAAAPVATSGQPLEDRVVRLSSSAGVVSAVWFRHRR
jgi:hypothetical protein